MIERTKIKVDASNPLARSYNPPIPIHTFISMLQHAHTDATKRGLEDVKVALYADEDDNYSYVQLIGYRNETDAELLRRMENEQQYQDAQERRERAQLNALLQKYGETKV